MKKYFIAFLLFFSFQVQAMSLLECNMSSEGAAAAVKRWIFDAERGGAYPSFIVRKNKDQEKEFIIPELLSTKVVSVQAVGGAYWVVVEGFRQQVGVYVHPCGGIINQ